MHHLKTSRIYIRSMVDFMSFLNILFGKTDVKYRYIYF